MVTFVLALALSLASAAAQVDLEAILARVSEEAEVFARNARNVVGEERLIHRAVKRPPRLRLRIGEDALRPRPIEYQRREIVSEYGFASLSESPNSLHEFRQVLSVDGRQRLEREKARQVLAMDMRSEEDRRRRRLLEQFERLGTSGATTDLGLMLLLFHRRGLDNYQFHFARAERLGAAEAIVLGYRQRPGPDALRVYRGRSLHRIPMQGELWVRKEDSVPLRVTMAVEMAENGKPLRFAAEVDYRASAHGFLLPAAVRYSERSEELLLLENLYEYSNFHMFSVEAEIKFTPESEAPPRE